MPLKLSEKHPDYPALLFGNYMFGGGASSRLFARIRTKEGLSYGVVGRFRTPVYESGSFTVGAIAAPSNVDKVEAVFKEEMAKALKDGFGAEEIAAAKKGWLQDKRHSPFGDRSLASMLADNEYEGRTMAYPKGAGREDFGVTSAADRRCDAASHRSRRS